MEEQNKIVCETCGEKYVPKPSNPEVPMIVEAAFIMTRYGWQCRTCYEEKNA